MGDLFQKWFGSQFELMGTWLVDLFTKIPFLYQMGVYVVAIIAAVAITAKAWQPSFVSNAITFLLVLVIAALIGAGAVNIGFWLLDPNSLVHHPATGF
jgi:hypothetical protein